MHNRKYCILDDADKPDKSSLINGQLYLLINKDQNKLSSPKNNIIKLVLTFGLVPQIK